MSNLRQGNDDDYPDAAGKHLEDAQILLNNNRYDGAGYHAGYVVECVLKTLLQIDNTFKHIHDLGRLSNEVARLVAGSGSPRTAPYQINPPLNIRYDTPPAGWKETMRYRAPGDLSQSQAEAWYDEAHRAYNQSIKKMRQDGVIR